MLVGEGDGLLVGVCCLLVLYLFGCVGRYLFCIGEVYVLRLLYGAHAHG